MIIWGTNKEIRLWKYESEASSMKMMSIVWNVLSKEKRPRIWKGDPEYFVLVWKVYKKAPKWKQAFKIENKATNMKTRFFEYTSKDPASIEDKLQLV